MQSVVRSSGTLMSNRASVSCWTAPCQRYVLVAPGSIVTHAATLCSTRASASFCATSGGQLLKITCIRASFGCRRNGPGGDDSNGWARCKVDAGQIPRDTDEANRLPRALRSLATGLEDPVIDFRPMLAQFAPLDGMLPESLPVSRMAGGLINDTFALGEHWVLQRLHRIFAAEVNLDIAALVPQLLQQGVAVPELRAARDGRPWVTVTDGVAELNGVWRILTRLPGDTLHQLADPHGARSAGQLAARFHGALADVNHEFAFIRPGAHDTDKHMTVLQAALLAHSGHRLYDAVAPLAEELLQRWSRWGRLPELPLRIVHGDLKVSNLLFQSGTASAVLDLDTMAHGTLDVELGDALRSWCNPATEDDPAPRFDVDVCLAAMTGYVAAAREWLRPEELLALPPGIERICLELSARFAADALNETYFGWDPTRFAGRGEHDMARARNQLALGRDIARQREPVAAALAELLTKP